MNNDVFRSIQNRQYGVAGKTHIYSTVYSDRNILQRLRLEKRLEAHRGCVNSICWNETGEHILSGSDDQHLVISNPFTGKEVVSMRSGHRANIFSARYIPFSSDSKVVSCSGDGKIYLTEVFREDTYSNNLFDCHVGTAYEILTVPNEASTFFSCGEDGTVRWFDLRVKSRCVKENCKEDVLINCKRAVTAMAVNPMVPYHLALSSSDGKIKIYDRRMLGTKATGNAHAKTTSSLLCLFSAPLNGRTYRITSLVYSAGGTDLLVSYSSEHVYLFNMKGGELENRELKTYVAPPAKQEAVMEHPSNESGKTKLKRNLNQNEPPPATDVPTAKPACSASSNTSESSNRQPPVKRLRLRGDWSDTGPSARPEGERAASETGRRSPHTTIMQRMSDMLTRWLDGTLRGDAPSESQDATDDHSESEVNESAPSEVDQTASHDNLVNEQIQSAANLVAEGATSSAGSQNSSQMPVLETTDDIQPSETSRSEAHKHDDVPTSASQSVSDKNIITVTKETEAQTASSGISDGRQVCSSLDRDEITCLEKESQPTSCHTHISAMHSQTDYEKIEPSCKKTDESNSNSKISGEIMCSGVINDTDIEKITVKSTFVSSDVQNNKVNPDCDSDSLEGSMHVCPPAIIAQKTICSNKDQNVGAPTALVSNNALVDSKCPSTCVDTVIEPVISLQYSSEGTSNSSVKLELSSFETVSSKGNLLMAESQRGQTLNEISDRKTDETVLMDIDAPQLPTLEPDEKPECDIPLIITTDLSDGNIKDSSDLSDTVSCDKKPGIPDSKDLGKDISKIDEVGSSEFGVAKSSTLSSSSAMEVDTCAEEMMHTVKVIPASSDKGAAGTSSELASGQDDSMQDKKDISKGKQPVRQRKIGFSGPPTGDFRLSLQDSDSSGEDSDDTSDKNKIELEDLVNFRQSWPRRNTAAYERSQFKPRVRMKYKGHRNARTMIKEANFWGDQYIMSGSDCGHVFIWNKNTAQLEMLLEGDKHVVNCLQPHPFYPILASSGIDYDVKIWTPSEVEPKFDEESSAELIRRNEVMLEETRDTITVPAAFMLRVLASLNQVRAGRRAANRQATDSDSSSDSE